MKNFRGNMEPDIEPGFQRVKRFVITFVVLMAMLAVVVFICSSCTTSKVKASTNIEKEEHHTVNTDSIRKHVADSISKKASDKLKDLQAEVEWYQENYSTINDVLADAQNAVVDSSISNDSLRTVISLLLQRKCPVNSAKINADGSVELNGALKSLRLRNSELEKKLDSVATHKGKEIQVKTTDTTSRKEIISQSTKEKKSWGFVQGLITGAVLMTFIFIFLAWRYRKKTNF